MQENSFAHRLLLSITLALAALGLQLYVLSLLDGAFPQGYLVKGLTTAVIAFIFFTWVQNKYTAAALTALLSVVISSAILLYTQNFFALGSTIMQFLIIGLMFMVLTKLKADRTFSITQVGAIIFVVLCVTLSLYIGHEFLQGFYQLEDWDKVGFSSDVSTVAFVITLLVVFAFVFELIGYGSAQAVTAGFLTALIWVPILRLATGFFPSMQSFLIHAIIVCISALITLEAIGKTSWKHVPMKVSESVVPQQIEKSKLLTKPKKKQRKVAKSSKKKPKKPKKTTKKSKTSKKKVKKTKKVVKKKKKSNRKHR